MYQRELDVKLYFICGVESFFWENVLNGKLSSNKCSTKFKHFHKARIWEISTL
jgi:hypothetical protein